MIIARTSGQKLAVMHVELGRYKNSNDTLGHDIGDQLLQFVAERLKKMVREQDVVARIREDEFAILLPKVADVDQMVEVAELVRTILDRPIIIEDYELYVTSSIGISPYPQGGDNQKTLMKNADAALYRAKEQGTNNYQIYSSSMGIQPFKSFSLEKDLRKPINHGELDLYYQPKVDAISGQIMSAEALIRWHHPEGGSLPRMSSYPSQKNRALLYS